MTWAFVWAFLAWALIPGVKRYGKLFVPAVLMLGILPDADLFLESVGIVHRTVTHSFFFWSILFVPVFIIFRLRAIPYFVAVVQHFAFGDFFMGKAMIFWPFSSKLVGLNFGMPSTVDVVLETVGLLVAAGVIIYNDDLRRLVSVERRNVFMVAPLLALVTSGLFFASQFAIASFVGYILSSKLLIALAAGHLILIGFLFISTLQGLRARKAKNK
jgi:membrane-bound metal-dependent hydrolase YbcI (DUF457 family)